MFKNNVALFRRDGGVECAAVARAMKGIGSAGAGKTGLDLE